jgi:ribonuclease G
MKKELLISYEEDASKIALIEDGRLFELHEIEKTDFVVGDIFVGKIKKLAPNLNAAFVNIGYEKDAFLHYQDLRSTISYVQKISVRHYV